jgi:hypothetical protein
VSARIGLVTSAFGHRLIAACDGRPGERWSVVLDPEPAVLDAGDHLAGIGSARPIMW